MTSSVPDLPLHGGCACGAVRYEVTEAIYHRTLCHCENCRRTTGAPCVAWFSVQVNGFRVLKGAARTFRSSPGAVRSFCGACGTQLTFQIDGRPEIDVTVCSLDEPERVPLADQTFTRSRLKWMDQLDRLPGHATVRQPPGPGPD